MCFQSLLLALRRTLKLSCHWSIACQWSSAGCWPRFSQTLSQLIDVRHWFLINMFLHVGFSRCLQAPVYCCDYHVFMGWKWMVHYCDVLLLKTLLSDICHAAGDFYFPAHHACARALICCGTRLQTSHQTWPPNRPNLNPVDYRIWIVI